MTDLISISTCERGADRTDLRARDRRVECAAQFLRQVLGRDTRDASSELCLTHLGRVAIALLCTHWRLQPDDEVLVPAYNCGSELDALLCRRLSLRFYPVDTRGQIDLDGLSPLLSNRTRLLYVVHYFGWMHPMRALRAWCDAHGVRLVEDAALSLFSRDSAGPPGALSDAAILSFPKWLPVPDGGALVLQPGKTPPPPLGEAPPARRVLRKRLQLLKAQLAAMMPLDGTLRRVLSRVRSAADPRAAVLADGRPEMPASYYFDESLAACRLSHVTAGYLPRVKVAQLIERRRANFRRLIDQLRDIPHIEPFCAELPASVCPLNLPLRVPRGARDRLCAALVRRGVTAIPWWAGYHRALDWTGFADAAALKDSVIALPIHQALGPSRIDAIASAARHVFAEQLTS